MDSVTRDLKRKARDELRALSDRENSRHELPSQVHRLAHEREVLPRRAHRLTFVGEGRGLRDGEVASRLRHGGLLAGPPAAERDKAGEGDAWGHAMRHAHLLNRVLMCLQSRLICAIFEFRPLFLQVSALPNDREVGVQRHCRLRGRTLFSRNAIRDVLTSRTSLWCPVGMSEEDTQSNGFAEPTNAGEVSVTGPGIAITRPVDEATMSSVIALLFGAAPGRGTGDGGGAARGGGGGVGGGGGAAGGGAAGGGGGVSAWQWDEDLTLGEFISETGASTFQQKICAAGYYLMNSQGRPSFTRDEIRTALANAHEDMPGNYARDFAGAAAAHLIAPKDGEAGQYIIPRTGRTAVTSNFQEVPRRKARKASKKSVAKAGAE